MIDIRCTLTEHEYLEAQQMFQQEQMKNSRWWRWTLCAVFVVSTGVTFWSLPRPISLGMVPPYAFALIVLSAMPLWTPLLQRRAFKNRYQKEKVNMTDAHITIDASGFRCEVPGIGSGVAEWSGMSGWQEGKSVFMIRSGYLMRIVPKRALSSEEMQSLVQILSARIAPKT